MTKFRVNVSETTWFEADFPGFSLPDSRYGFAARPGKHTVTMGHLAETKDFTMTIDADGLRITCPPEDNHADMPEVWLFGCSFTLGYAVEDHETMPWILQSRFCQLNIKNFAFGGWGTTAGFVALRESLKMSKPALVIFTYNPFHSERNVASPNYVKYFTSPLDLMYLRAGFLEDGELYLSLVPIIRQQPEHLMQVDHQILRSDPYYTNEVTKRLFANVRQLVETNGARLLVALQSGDATDPVFTWLKQQGFEVADLAVPWVPENMCLPFDNHPNAATQRKYADALTPLVAEMISPIIRDPDAD